MDLDRVRELGGREAGLAVVFTTRRDGSAQASVVNAGVVAHPVRNDVVVGFVVRGRARKLENLHARPRATIVFRSGREWVAVEGDAEVAGPDDCMDGLGPHDLARLLREIYAAAAGGDPDDWRHLDDVIGEERHTAVLVKVRRIYSNPRPA